MAFVQSVNVGAARLISSKSGSTGIDKVPTAWPVTVFDPGPDGAGTSGLSGDVVCDVAHHGGGDQALYAYAREDLDRWQDELGATLRSGIFGENLTTSGLDVSGALIGETWRIGDHVVLQVTSPRIPCSTFAVWMNRKGWLKTFTRSARPGAYLRVLSGGEVQATDPLGVEFRPSHSVTIERSFRALTLEPELLPGLLEASEHLNEEMLLRSKNREPFVIA